MDAINREIVETLRRDGRISFSALGRRVGLGTNSVAARVRRLEADGVILGYRAILDVDHAVVPTGIEAFIDVRLHPDRDSEQFLRWAQRDAVVIDAVHVTGPYDYLLRVCVPDTAGLDRFLRRIKSDAGAAQTQTRIALRPER